MVENRFQNINLKTSNRKIKSGSNTEKYFQEYMMLVQVILLLQCGQVANLFGGTVIKLHSGLCFEDGLHFH